MRYDWLGLVCCIALVVLAGLVLKQERKVQQRILYKGCYVWHDGYTQCTPNVFADGAAP